MTLLIFEQFNLGSEDNTQGILEKLPEYLKELLDYSNRQRLASWVNEIILESMGFQSEHQLGFYW